MLCHDVKLNEVVTFHLPTGEKCSFKITKYKPQFDEYRVAMEAPKHIKITAEKEEDNNAGSFKKDR